MVYCANPSALDIYAAFGKLTGVTAQQPDVVLVDRVHFEIVGVEGGPLFDPSTEGIEPSMITTACWRGYICTYTTAGGRLRLRNLELGVKSILNGEQLTEDSVVLGVKVGMPLWSYVLRRLSLPVPFSGGLLLGKGFIRSLYEHMGFHPAWKYERVLELLLTDGVVTDCLDRSSAVAEVRSKIEAGTMSDPDESNGDLLKWIDRSFTLDYIRSFGSSE